MRSHHSIISLAKLLRRTFWTINTEALNFMLIYSNPNKRNVRRSHSWDVNSLKWSRFQWVPLGCLIRFIFSLFVFIIIWFISSFVFRISKIIAIVGNYRKLKDCRIVILERLNKNPAIFLNKDMLDCLSPQMTAAEELTLLWESIYSTWRMLAQQTSCAPFWLRGLLTRFLMIHVPLSPGTN